MTSTPTGEPLFSFNKKARYWKLRLNRLPTQPEYQEYRQKMLVWKQEAEKAFTEHPEATGETYLQHLWFTLKMAGRFAYISGAIVFHGLFPFLCTTTASRHIEQIYRIMKTRIPKQRRDEIDREDLPPIRIHTKQGEIRLAIIGGGFSGTMVLANLIRQAEGHLVIDWFDDATPAEGVAYGTKESIHLLNVRADRMGAFAKHPNHFHQWLQTEHGRKALAEYNLDDSSMDGASYLPRIIYGTYLKGILSETLEKAKAKGISIVIHKTLVEDIVLKDEFSQTLLLRFKESGITKEMIVDAAVLATGNLPPRAHPFQRGLSSNNHTSRYVDDVWHPPAGHMFPQNVNELSPDSEIVIIGTGLTTVDTVLTLRQHGYKGKIIAISRNGLLPNVQQHGESYPLWEWVHSPHYAPKTAYGLLKRLRQEVQEAEKQGYSWQSVVDSIRPVTQTLWKQLSVQEKRVFLNRLGTLWNVHRHRMAPEIHRQIKELQQNGTFEIITGKIYYIGEDKEGLTVAYRKRGTNRVETLRPALVLNCTGPQYDIAASDHDLLKKLRDHELITIGVLRAGIEITSNGTAKGRASESLFPVGSLMVGELLECTAVPELREQAADVASRVLMRVKDLHEPESRARLIMGEAI